MLHPASTPLTSVIGATPLVQWLCMGTAEHGFFVPAYVNLTDTPDAYKVPGTAYNTDAAYWTFRTVSTLAEINREFVGSGVSAYLDIYQQQLIDQIEAADAEIMALGKNDAAAYATQLFADMSADALAKAKTLADEMMFYIARNRSMNATPRAPFATSLMPKE